MALILMPASTAINAVYQGRVVFAEWLRGFGLMAIIDHGSGYMTFTATRMRCSNSLVIG